MKPTSRSIDLRLLPIATGLWLAEALVLFSSGRVGSTWMLVRLTAWGGAAFLLGAAAVSRRTVRPVLAVAGAAVLLGCGLATMRSAALAAQPLVAMAQQQAVVTADVRMTSAPTYRRQSSLAGFGSPDAPPTDAVRWRVSGNVIRISEGPRQWAMRLPVVVQGSANTPGDISSLVPGSVIRVRAAVAPAQPARPSVAMLSVRGQVVVLSQAPWWQRGGDDVRAAIRQASIGLPDDAAGLLPGLTVGDVNAMPTDLTDDMRTVNMSHLTAVSGSNLAIVTGLVLFIAIRLRFPRRLSVGVAFLAMLAFIVVVGPQPSVLRAGVMATVALAALATGRGRAGIAGLLVTVVVLLLVDPWLALSAGFALSVCATAGLLVWAIRRLGRPRHQLSWPARLRGVVMDAFGIALAAQLATAPVVAGLGSGIALVGIPANVLAAPAVPLVTVIGLAAAVVGLVSPTLAHLLALVAGFPAGWIAMVARKAAAVLGGVLSWPHGLMGAVLLAAVMLAIAALVIAARRHRALLRRPPRQILGAIAATIAVVITVSLLRPSAYGASWPPNNWLAVVCDVGQGDAIVIATAPRHAMVIDAGPDPKAADSCLRDLGVTTIDMLVLTHFHADHVEGIPGLIKGRAVGRIVVSPLAEPPGEVSRVEKWLGARALNTEAARIGEQGSVGALSYRILGPKRIIRGQGSDPNNASVSLLVVTGSVRLLLTGDLERPGQADLMASEPPINADVIKVAHHGSRNQDPGIVSWSGARLAVISVGARNTYGHPARQTIDSLRSAGAVVTQTDRNGAVAVITGPDGTPTLATQRRPG